MYEIFEQLLQKYGVTPYKVSKATGVSQSSLSDWKLGKITPTTKTLQKIADYFGVTIDYLMTGEKKEENNQSDSKLSNVYFSFARDAEKNGIDPNDIKMAIDMIKKLRGQ